MTQYIANDTDLTSVANAIRSKTGGSSSLAFPSGMVSAIQSISGGGISGGHNITLKVDGTDWQIISVADGESMSAPTNPIKSGYVFSGWSTTSGGSVNVTFPYTPTADATWYAVFNAVLQYKASPVGYGNSSPSSVTFSSNSNLINWTPEEVTIGSDVFIKFPTFYRKVIATSNNQITSFIISSWKEDNDFQPYPCFLDENGNTLPYVLMGKYCSTSSTTANSQDGSAASMTIGNARTLCRAKGNGYQQMDWQIFKLWQDLLCCKMQTINTNSGSGITTDSLGVVWRQNGSYLYPWVDGVNTVTANNNWVFSYKPSAYVDQATSSTTDYIQASYAYSGTSGQEIMSLGYDSSNPFFNYPKSTTSNSNYNTYYCDAFYFGASATHPVDSAVGGAYAYYGAFNCSAHYGWSYTYGFRLCYRPL